MFGCYGDGRALRAFAAWDGETKIQARGESPVSAAILKKI